MSYYDVLDCCGLGRELDNRCPQDGRSVAEHCAAGMHCTSTTASCSAEQAGDDHPAACCDCKVAM
jgi:hypothetical protein